jgi:hypothetical protein
MGAGSIGASESVRRNLILIVESESDVDIAQVEQSMRQLRAELNELDVESVVWMTGEKLPSGAKGLDASSVGSLLITMTSSGVFTGLIATVGDWLARNVSAQRISVTIDGDTIVLDKASEQERSALIEAYVRRHEVR